MTRKFAVDKSLSEIAIIYAVMEEFPNQDGKVIMPVCFRLSVRVIPTVFIYPISIPINGV